MAKKRILKKTIFIACEGSNTEPLYFENIKENQENDDYYPYSITIYPDKEVDENPKTDAIGLINVAIERREDFDELWVVFDKDGYTKHKEAFELANEHNINIAFSSIAFETWILLHFERCDNPFLKSANIINDKFHTNEVYLIDYDKSGDYNVMPFLISRIETAFENSIWLRSLLNTEEPNFAIYNANPYTDVDFLVKKLILSENVYEYQLLGQIMSFKQIDIALNVNGSMIKVKISNNRNVSLVTNQFEFLDLNKSRIEVKNNVINSNKFVEFDLIEVGVSPKIFIVFENLRLEIDYVE